MKKILIIIIALVMGNRLVAQDTLSLSEAVQLALEHNYGIRAARNNIQRSQNSAHAGNAGLLPNVTLSGGANYNLNNRTALVFNQLGGGDTATTSLESEETVINNIETSSANAGVGLSYTVFDGLGNVNNFRVLKTNVFLTREQTRSVVEQNLVQVINTYYQLAEQYNSVRLLEETLDISRQRLARAKSQNEYGANNKLSVLNAEVDFNTDSVNLVRAQLVAANARRDLNLLIGQDTEAQYAVSRGVSYQQNLILEDLQSQALQGNATLSSQRYNQQLAELNLRIAKASRYPRLDINGNYGYTYQNNGPANFLRTLNVWGFTGGATLSMNLFDGNRTRKNIENAQVDISTAKIQYEEVEASLHKDVSNNYASYQNNIRILALEQKSLEAAQLNFERTQELFDLGQASNIDFREAQLNLFNVKNRLNSIQYDIKLQETNLMQLSGQLVQE